MVNTAPAPVNPVSGEYLSITAAAKLWGISPITLQRKRKAAGVADYASPTDERVKLVRRTDLVKVLGLPASQPKPTS